MDLRTKYEQQSKEVAQKVERLRKIIKQHKRCYEKDPRNWGYLADMVNLANRLEDIINFTRM
jgi:hypothetical protein